VYRTDLVINEERINEVKKENLTINYVPLKKKGKVTAITITIMQIIFIDSFSLFRFIVGRTGGRCYI